MTVYRAPRQRRTEDEAEDRRQIWKWREDLSKAATDADAHIAASTGVHGVGSGSSVVGTVTVQVLTNKDIRQTVRATAINTALTTTDETLKCTAAVTVTLPTAVGVTGKVYRIDNATTGTTTVNPQAGQTIEGVSSQTMIGEGCMVLYSDGSNWRFQ